MFLALATSILGLQLISAIDVGFELQYTSQPRTCVRQQVYFDKPLPSWLKGTFAQNSMGQFEMGDRKLRHAFDGFAKLFGWHFVNENETYFSTQFIKTGYYKESKEKNTIAPWMLFDVAIPAFSWGELAKAVYNGIDNTNINIVRFGGKEDPTYVAMSDFWTTYSFDPDTLETEAQIKTPVPGGEPLIGMIPVASSAHPVPEYGTNNHITFVNIINPLPFMDDVIRLVRVKSLFERELITEIKTKQMPYMHSFVLSEHYAVIMEAPLYSNMVKLFLEGSPSQSFIWDPKKPMKMHLVELATAKTSTIDFDPIFPMHFVNAYEEDNKLIFDYVVYHDFEVIKYLQMENVLDPVKRNDVPVFNNLYRYTIDLETHAVSQRDISSSNSFDMPVINEAYRHKKHCYVYGISAKADGVNFANMTLSKKDLCNNYVTDDLVWYKENHYVSEPWFVATPGATEEDDGLLMCAILNGETEKSYLAVFDAKTLTLINQSEAPFHLPQRLHGRFYD